MRYEVRYQVNGTEFTRELDAADAAMAASTARADHPDPADRFELIQVQLLDEMPEAVATHADWRDSSSPSRSGSGY